MVFTYAQKLFGAALVICCFVFVVFYYFDGLFKAIYSAASKLKVINSFYSQLVISGMIRNFAVLFKFQIQLLRADQTQIF